MGHNGPTGKPGWDGSVGETKLGASEGEQLQATDREVEGGYGTTLGIGGEEGGGARVGVEGEAVLSPSIEP